MDACLCQVPVFVNDAPGDGEFPTLPGVVHRPKLSHRTETFDQGHCHIGQVSAGPTADNNSYIDCSSVTWMSSIRVDSAVESLWI